MEAAEIEQPSRPVELSDARAWLLGVIAPGAAGLLISIIWRPKGTYFWPWLEQLSLDRTADALRMALGGVGPWLPSWVLYSLPGALYAFTLTMAAALLIRERDAVRSGWVWAPMGLAWAHEGAQWIGLRPGSADWQDAVGYGLGALCAWAVTRTLDTD